MMERDRFLTEAMGHVWHECQDNPDGFYCRQCAEGLHRTADFSIWDGFGELWGWAQLQDWWGELYYGTLHVWGGPCGCDMAGVRVDMINPSNFADAIYALLKDRPCEP